MTGGVLALDIASRTGWAYASAEQVQAWPLVPMACREHPRVAYSHFSVTAGVAGSVWASFQDHVQDLLKVHAPTLIAYEAAIRRMRNGKSTAETIERLLAFKAMTQYTAARWRVPAVAGNVQTVRKHFVGMGRPADAKATVIDGCRRRGWDPKNDDQADALALLDWAIADLRARQAA